MWNNILNLNRYTHIFDNNKEELFSSISWQYIQGCWLWWRVSSFILSRAFSSLPKTHIELCWRFWWGEISMTNVHQEIGYSYWGDPHQSNDKLFLIGFQCFVCWGLVMPILQKSFKLKNILTIFWLFVVRHLNNCILVHFGVGPISEVYFRTLVANIILLWWELC